VPHGERITDNVSQIQKHGDIEEKLEAHKHDGECRDNDLVLVASKPGDESDVIHFYLVLWRDQIDPSL
jgi:hypothetical protein